MTSTDTAWGPDAGRLLALAVRAEGHGQYNLAKVLRAAAQALAAQAAHRLDQPADRASVLAGLAEAQAALERHGLGDAAAALERGRARMAEGKVAFAQQIPDPHVCRRCGHLAVGRPPAPCPTCGSWPETFQRFRPVYWLEALDPPAALERLRSTPDQVAAFLDGLSEDALAQQPPGGGWSMRQVVAHLRDAQGVLRARVKLLLEQDEPDLASQSVWEWAAQDQSPASTREIFDAYRRVRGEVLATLEGIPLRDWWRSGRHEEFGSPMTLKEQASYFAAHETHHLRQLRELRAWLAG